MTMRTLITLLVIGAGIYGVRAFIEHDVENKIFVAEEMYQDGEYDSALGELRRIHRWFAWTEAYQNEGEALREKVRKRRVEERQRRQEEAEAREFDRQWQEEVEEEEKRLERQRRLDAYQESVRQRRQGGGYN